MWTHNKPYQKSQKTEKSIEEHGRIALSRALNIGRVVGFIGSGVSIAYGRPTWTELIEHVLAELDRWRDDWKADWQSRSENLPPEILSLFDQIDFLIGRASGSTPSGSIELNRLAAQDLTTILEIIDSLFGAIGALSIPGPRLETLRENVAQFLMKNRSQISKERFYNNIPDQLETLNAIDWSSSYAEQDAYFQVVTGKTLNQQDIGELNPVHHIYETLRIRRFMTLNFDVEIERYLAKALGITVKAPGRAQEQLLSLIESESKGFKPNGNNRRIAIETGLERSLLTVTMAEENVGELVNFAMHPKAYSAQVFHLHGRIDDPENMVISERDYQRIYMPDDQGRRTFREALESVFAGNDVLFIGVGLRETDIMRPLRQFVSQDRSSDSEARRVFALMEQVVEFDPSIPPADQIRLDRQKEIQRTLRLNVQYGVHTIVYGESDARHARMACNALQAFAEGQISASDVRTHVEQALAQQDLARQLWDEKTGDSRLTFQKLVTDIEAEQIEEILRLDPLFYEEQSKRKAISGYARCLENRVRLRALCRELEALARRSADWWKEWRQMPRHREAIFREHRVNAACPIWVRHRADYCDIEADDPVPSTINKLRKLAGAQGELTAEGHRRVLCVVMERGAGKGALTNLLQQPVRSKDGQPSSTAYYETIFSGATYVGAFFAHLSFSMEFSSVIVALTRFVAGRLADVHGCSHSVQNEMEMSPGEALRRFSPEDSAPEETFSRGTHRLTLLRRLLNAFEKAPHRSGRRLFVCLSGVHRLCNEEGIARNPMHRAFFRLLSGYGLKTPNESPFVLPIDLLILSGNADHPIRYLNEEC